MLLSASATGTNGLSAVEVAWLDSNINLENQGNLELDMDLQYSLLARGAVSVRLTSGQAPLRPHDPESVVLNEASEPDTASPPINLRIRLLASAKLALVYGTERAHLEDLLKLKQWRLRFLLKAETSSGFAPATNVVMTVDRVHIRRLPATTGIIGVITDWGSGKAIEGAKISWGPAGQRTSSLPSGAFWLATGPGRLRLRVEREEYQPLEQSEVEVEPGKYAPLRLEMEKRREALEVGDVVEVIRMPGRWVAGMDALNNQLSIVASHQDRNMSLLRLDLVTRGEQLQVDFGEPNGFPGTNANENLEFSGLAWCGEDLIATLAWAGRICRLNGKKCELLRLFRAEDQDFRGLVDRESPDHSLRYPRDPAWDGRRLWFVERDEQIGGRYGLWAFNLQTRKLIAYLRSSDKGITGLAWGKDTLWVSSRRGRVYQLDPELALRGKSLDAGRGREFEGRYLHLTFSGGFLWGWDDQRQCLCQIKTDAK